MMEETALYYQDMAFELERQARKQAVHELNGHFLFNALTVIMFMTRSEPLCARELEKEFGDYLRGVMTQAGGALEWIPLARELRIVRSYLHIQSVRFMGRITYELEIGDEDALVPAGMLRSLVENAVSHGICHKTGDGCVRIAQEITGGRHRLCVIDNGEGFDVNALNPIAQGGIRRIRGTIKQIRGASFDIFSKQEIGRAHV